MTLALNDSTPKPKPFSPSLLGQFNLIHLVVIVLSLVMTIGVWQYSKIQVASRIETRFEVARDAAVGLLKDGMQKYEDALWAGVAAMESHGNDMTLPQWQDFSSTLRIDERYPGINGIGVIHFLTPDALPAYLAQRQSERPDFTVFPAHDRPLKMPISFIEPAMANKEAIGLDVAHEENRYAAALASRDTGMPQITGPITLVQDAGHTPGFLFYAPFYRDDVPVNAKHDPSDVVGAVYAPFVVRKLMAGLLAKDLRNIRFSITDAGQTIYDEHSAPDVSLDPDPMFTDQVSVDLYGRSWTLDMRTNLAFRADNLQVRPNMVLAAGLIIEALIIALIVMLSRANAQAVKYADKVTAELRREKHKLAATNEELEQFAYVASHDLKTPIRGIGGLTEMLREDLDDYLTSPDALPEVAQNLDRIDARVARMTELTRGIMEFSRVGAYERRSDPLSLPEAVETMIADFELEDGQLELHTAEPIVEADTFNLRRVLENLVGNSIKYHDGVRPLKISIDVTRVPKRLQFSVTDNGPGIDPRFHQRVFEVFQTLRDANAPESTGIGLAIVKKLVERQGGAITLSSEPDEGTTFRFDWPAKIETTAATSLEKAA